jgi:formylglycine-generating enzyme required for sulfatase activity
MESVTWFECSELLARHGLSLPSEVQWEYAATNGRTSEFPWGDDANQLFQRAHLEGRAPLAVGSKPADDFGLHDCLGNVSEWCLDVAASYRLPLTGPAQVREAVNAAGEPRNIERGAGFFLRGSPQDRPVQLLIARPRTRIMTPSETRRETLGLRVARRVFTE